MTARTFLLLGLLAPMPFFIGIASDSGTSVYGNSLSATDMKQISGSNPQTQRYLLDSGISCTLFTFQHGSVISGHEPEVACPSFEGEPCFRCSVAFSMYYGLQQAMGNGGDEDVPQDCGIIEYGTCQPDGSGEWTCLKENTGNDCIDLILVQSQ